MIQVASLALASLEASPEALWVEQRLEPCQAGGPFGGTVDVDPDRVSQGVEHTKSKI